MFLNAEECKQEKKIIHNPITKILYILCETYLFF